MRLTPPSTDGSKYSLAALRTSLGLVFLGFGLLKLFPGMNPAESIVRAAVEVGVGGRGRSSRVVPEHRRGVEGYVAHDGGADPVDGSSGATGVDAG